MSMFIKSCLLASSVLLTSSFVLANETTAPAAPEAMHEAPAMTAPAEHAAAPAAPVADTHKAKKAKKTKKAKKEKTPEATDAKHDATEEAHKH